MLSIKGKLAHERGGRFNNRECKAKIGISICKKQINYFYDFHVEVPTISDEIKQLNLTDETTMFCNCLKNWKCLILNSNCFPTKIYYDIQHVWINFKWKSLDSGWNSGTCQQRVRDRLALKLKQIKTGVCIGHETSSDLKMDWSVIIWCGPFVTAKMSWSFRFD